MVLFNYSTKELTAKIVYYGPGLCGKTTNLQWIHEKLPIKNKGKMLSLATETDRTLFFDFLPIELGTIRGMRTRVQLYTVPGQVFYNATRRMVLKGADCIVFVVDSQEPMLEANLESWDNMRQNLEANEIDAREIPVVLQYNKRDLPNALPIEILNERLNPRDVPFHEAVAVKGIGVEESLKTATALVFRSLATKYGPTPALSTAGASTAPLPPVAERSPGLGSAPAAVAAPVAAPAPPPELEPLPTPRAATVLPETATAGEDLLSQLEQPSPSVPVPVLEEEFALDEEEPFLPAAGAGPSRAAAPAATPGRDTLASNPQEAERIRERIRQPPAPYEPVMFEAIDDEDDEEIEELTLEAVASELEPPARLAEVDEETVPEASPDEAAAPNASADDEDEDIVFEVGPEMAEADPSPPAPAVVPAAATARAAVTLPATAGPEAAIEVPVDVTLHEGAAQVHLHLRLTINLKLTD